MYEAVCQSSASDLTLDVAFFIIIIYHLQAVIYN
jgi:hypothetical protein